MFEKVNPSHPDKIADRIAGAVVDLAYKKKDNPHIAVEVLIGHGECYMIIEADLYINEDDIYDAVRRISGVNNITINYVMQDKALNDNQLGDIRCGDNGIFRGVKTNDEEQVLTDYVGAVYSKVKADGKYLMDAANGKITICQSNVYDNALFSIDSEGINELKINPLGPWTGGLDVDSGATNRKLGSDMGRAASGGGLHGKDLSKADVTMNICAFLDQKDYMCSIGDEYIDGVKYSEYVKRAKKYIDEIGGFEKFAEWGLIRPKTINI